MKPPSHLPLYGFANPRGQSPAFLVPIFGTKDNLWIQDGEDTVVKFSQCSLPSNEIITENTYQQFSTKIGEQILYAFQYSDDKITIAPKAVIRDNLEDRLEEFYQNPFLVIDILKFIGKYDVLLSAIKTAGSELANYNPKIAEMWASSMRDQHGLLEGGNSQTTKRELNLEGAHTKEVIKVLQKDLKAAGIDAARKKASRILDLSVDPTGGIPSQPSDGLLYGLIQSGKTSIITMTTAMAADNGFDCILILTTDIDILYEQTLDRIKTALRGLTILGKRDWSDKTRFQKQLKSKPFGIVCTKNGSMLKSLLTAFKTAKAKGLSVLIIDDEADQASLNTLTSKKEGKVSPINQAISDFRNYFPINTYLQVTATPQALFLQSPGHKYRPTFTVLTEPGGGYVGGEDFFGSKSKLLRIVSLDEVNELKSPKEENKNPKLPIGLKSAVYTFFVAAAAKIIERPADNFAFLCHTSMSTKDHKYIGELLDDFKLEMVRAFENKSSKSFIKIKEFLKKSYDDLAKTEFFLPSFEDGILPQIDFYIKGTNVKLINALTSDEIKLDSAFNIFVGGNKLGRGVTIKNLLVSYYGRNPKTPKADTVLQHARMYGYRSADLGVTRLFLPQRLADQFRSIHEMEKSLRGLLKKYPDGCFEGIYISGNWTPTRGNILNPDLIGYYVEGRSYNPRKPLRTKEASAITKWLDEKLSKIPDYDGYTEINFDEIANLINRIKIDPTHGAELWNVEAINSALEILEQKYENDKAYLVVRRDRNLKRERTESHGIIQSAEAKLAPLDAPTLFMYRTNAYDEETAVWWPQLRFPDGEYAIAFAFDW